MEGDDSLGVGHHHVVHELEGLVQAILLAVRPGCRRIKLPSAVAGISLKVNHVLDLGNSAKQNLAYSTKASIVVRAQKAIAAVLVKGLGRIKVIEA